MKIKIITLIDNKPHPSDHDLLTEHGLSFYFETGDEKYLFDVGASDAFCQNAKHLGINIEDIDYLFISHAHSDHTGGLPKFMEVNTKAKIYLSEHIIGQSFYSSRRGTKKDISMPKVKISSRFHFVANNNFIDEQIKLISIFPNSSPKPMGNKSLFSQKGNEERPDNFEHEIALLVKQGNDYIILSACSHNGLLNTLSACTNAGSIDPSQITAYIGGLHLLDSDKNNQYETEEEIRSLCKTLLTSYPRLQLISGHCTGNSATQIFEDEMNDRFKSFYSGFQIIL